MTTAAIPKAFIWRRVHSLMGLWLVLFLLEHLMTNSQAALWLGEDGRGFVQMVNLIHNLPYLHVVEVALLGIPIALHMILGIRYIFSGKSNAKKTDGSSPSMRKYGRNKAYTWQRITSWLLLVGLIAHVVNFRFLEYPKSVVQGNKTDYFVKLDMDDGLYSLAYRLDVKLFDKGKITAEKEAFSQRADEKALIEAAGSLKEEKLSFDKGVESTDFTTQKEIIFQSAESYRLKEAWINTLTSFSLKNNQVVAKSTSFGTATLLTVRNTFKQPLYAVLYTLFVLAACFHAFNGFWTFLISWGFIVKRSAQKMAVSFSLGLMGVITFLGLAAIWGTWFNLKG